VNTDLMCSLGTLLLVCLATPAEAGDETSTTNELCVMSFNLRYASATPPNAWPNAARS
jgi:hypothetical protein